MGRRDCVPNTNHGSLEEFPRSEYGRTFNKFTGDELDLLASSLIVNASHIRGRDSLTFLILGRISARIGAIDVFASPLGWERLPTISVGVDNVVWNHEECLLDGSYHARRISQESIGVCPIFCRSLNCFGQ